MLSFVALGHSPLAMSEGHRAIPAWEMLDSGDWLVPTLFGQPYLRKPPGVQWAMALSSLIFGRTEFAVRAVSAGAIVVGALLSWFFARRWFGTAQHARTCALAAGLLFPLTPLFWYPGRSAEIESLHNTCVLAVLLTGLDLLIPGERSRRQTLGAVAAVATAIAAAALTKGPAAAPALIGLVVAVALVTRSLNPLKRPAFWIALAAAGVILAGVGTAISGHVKSLALPPVTQSPAGFLWDTGKLGSILSLPISSLVSALPGSLLLPWALRRCAPPHARALALTIGISLFLYTALGVSNNRYVMPVLTLVPIAAAYAFRGFAEAVAEDNRLWVRLGRLALLHRAWIPAVVLTMAAAAHHIWLELRRESISGRATGVALAGALPDGSTIIANQMIEYRPETFHYASHVSRERGEGLTIRWIPPAVTPPTGSVYVALRNPPDPAVRSTQFELDTFANPNRPIVFRGIVHRFEVEVIGPR